MQKKTLDRQSTDVHRVCLSGLAGRTAASPSGQAVGPAGILASLQASRVTAVSNVTSSCVSTSLALPALLLLLLLPDIVNVR